MPMGNSYYLINARGSFLNRNVLDDKIKQNLERS